MRSDKYGNPIFEESDIFDLLYQEVDISKLASKIIVGNLENFEKNSGINFLKVVNQEKTITEFDVENQLHWAMPTEYKNMDIEEFLVHVCPKQNYERLISELQEYRTRDMLDLLKWLKYLVDTLRANNIVWGVGRGSSVASYVLYLIGVHKIDSIKYNLDFKEFLR